MYIIVVAFILGFTFLSVNIIKDFILNLLNTSSNTYISGVIWFGGLIFLNILIFIFIQFSHYYINTQVSNGTIGRKGIMGEKGNIGNNEIKCIN